MGSWGTCSMRRRFGTCSSACKLMYTLLCDPLVLEYLPRGRGDRPGIVPARIRDDSRNAAYLNGGIACAKQGVKAQEREF